MAEQGAGELDDGVAPPGEVGVGERDAVVGGDAELGGLAVGVVHGAGREAHRPAVGQRVAEGQARSAAGAVAHDGDKREVLHVLYELVGRAVYAAVGKHAHGLLPPQAGRRLYPLLLHSREVVVAGAGLVLYVAHEHRLVGESGGKPLGVGERAAAVAAYVDYQPPA